MFAHRRSEGCSVVALARFVSVSRERAAIVPAITPCQTKPPDRGQVWQAPFAKRSHYLKRTTGEVGDRRTKPLPPMWTHGGRARCRSEVSGLRRFAERTHRIGFAGLHPGGSCGRRAV